MLAGLLTFEVILVILNIWTPVVIARLVHLNWESNFVVWFSSAQLLLGSLTALLIASQVSPFRFRIPWYLLAILLLLLSIDETAMVHENLAPRLPIPAPGSPLLEGHWLMIALPFVIGGVLLLGWLVIFGFRNVKPARRLMMIALICWCLSLTFEGIQHHSKSLFPTDSLPIYYRAGWITEEFLEMAGASLLWCALGLRLCFRVTSPGRAKESVDECVST
jgi:hypothetical protein